VVVSFASGREVRLAIVVAQARKKASFSTSAYTWCQEEFAIQPKKALGKLPLNSGMR